MEEASPVSKPNRRQQGTQYQIKQSQKQYMKANEEKKPPDRIDNNVEVKKK